MSKHDAVRFISGALCMLVLLAAFVRVRRPWR